MEGMRGVRESLKICFCLQFTVRPISLVVVSRTVKIFEAVLMSGEENSMSSKKA